MSDSDFNPFPWTPDSRLRCPRCEGGVESRPWMDDPFSGDGQVIGEEVQCLNCEWSDEF